EHSSSTGTPSNHYDTMPYASKLKVGGNKTKMVCGEDGNHAKTSHQRGFSNNQNVHLFAYTTHSQPPFKWEHKCWRSGAVTLRTATSPAQTSGVCYGYRQAG
ncbi:unnamed protein product, partial [Ectocarpus sp. 13 AM-2016]